MFTIKPAAPEDYFDIKEIFEEKGEELKLSPDMCIMVARENGFCGIGVYVIHDNCYAEFTKLYMKDDSNLQMKYFICKAVLNSIDLKGIKDVVSKISGEDRVLKMCRFTKDIDGVYKLNLTGYFDAGCHCGEFQQ